MPTKVENFTLNDLPIGTVRDFEDWTINANFEFSPNASINLPSVLVENTKDFDSSDTLRNAHDTFPTEGAILSFDVSNDTTTLPFRFICDYNGYSLPAPNATEVTLRLDKSIDSLLDLQGADINMALLEDLGVLSSSDYINFPYVVNNRKTLLEKAVLLGNIFLLFKSAVDEIFKILNISADITTLGVAQALLNLAQTLVSLAGIIIQLVELIKQLDESFNPAIRYHSAISLKTYLTKAVDYLGYNIDFGTWSEDIILIPSKKDEVGNKEPNTTDEQSGILKPSDFGYRLNDAFALAQQFCNGELAVINDTVHVRPKNDPFWLTTSGFIMPNVLVEQSIFVENGNRRFNREDVYAGKIISCSTDDSDYWTLQDFATDQNGDRLSVATVKPVTVINQRAVNLNGIISIDIPYALVVRKNTIDDLIDSIKELYEGCAFFIDEFEMSFGDVSVVLLSNIVEIGGVVPVFPSLGEFVFSKDGTLRVENHFFSTPKFGILELNNSGQYRIPENYNELIGAKALYQKYYTYDSLVPGVRNPEDENDTAGKEVFENVEIPFTLKDLDLLLNNSYFSTEDGRIGRFTAINWNIQADKATVSYWIQNNWLVNTIETLG